MGAVFVNIHFNESEPKLCTFSAKASENELNFVKVAIVIPLNIKQLLC
jgi:hypothetical protein